jgi:hypothetical protein
MAGESAPGPACQRDVCPARKGRSSRTLLCFALQAESLVAATIATVVATAVVIEYAIEYASMLSAVITPIVTVVVAAAAVVSIFLVALLLSSSSSSWSACRSRLSSLESHECLPPPVGWQLPRAACRVPPPRAASARHLRAPPAARPRSRHHEWARRPWPTTRMGAQGCKRAGRCARAAGCEVRARSAREDA